MADTDWRSIAAWYVVLDLDHLTPSLVIKLNHAAAVVRAASPQAGLRKLDALVGTALGHYPLYHVARGDALERLGHIADAADAFTRAVAEETNLPLRRLYERRAENATRLRHI